MYDTRSKTHFSCVFKGTLGIHEISLDEVVRTLESLILFILGITNQIFSNL